MSEQLSISSLGDGYTLGSPISSRAGVNCYPAIDADARRFIVKTITVPASQTQMDALLLTGAFPDSASALDYFREQAESISGEAELLQRLSKLEGFLAYNACTLSTPGDNQLGYQVSLVSPFRRSLERYIRTSPVTHLEVVNLGLDLCAALACARRAGYLYVDLKPSNIFISDEKEYKIGDLGFVALDAMSFTSMPEKYLSPYTAPELRDPLEVINGSADTYSVGMILYRLLNGGKLPAPSRDWSEPLNAPVHADREIWEIILKACAPVPADRWENPTAMGQALVAYMQRNTIDNIPLTEPVVNRQTGKLPKFTGILPKIAAEQVADGQTVVFSAVGSTDKADTAVPASDEKEESADAVSEAPAVEEAAEASAPEQAESERSAEAEEAEEAEEAYVQTEETAEEETAVNAEAEAPSVPDESKHGIPGLKARRAYDPGTPKDVPAEEKPKKKFPWKKVLISITVLAILAAAGMGTWWYYTTMYVQHVDALEVSGTRDGLTVSVQAGFDTGKLTVSCVDPYGNAKTAPVVNGAATFEDLRAGTLYNITVQPGQGHKLEGETYAIFTTDHEANVVSLSAVAGAEDGTMIVSLNVDGREPEKWLAVCSAEGVEDTAVTFSGHSVTIRGLTVGKDYLLSLSAEDGSAVSGKTRLEFSVSGLILAEGLTISSEQEGTLEVVWNSPKLPVESWEVRCYSENYDKTQNVVDTRAVFEDIDSAYAYTVEVTAAGMTQSSRATLSANPIRITDFKAAVSGDTINLSWTATGATPVGGWLVMYGIDGSATPNVAKTEKTTAEIKLVIPNSTYEFTIQAADGTSIFNNVYREKTPEKAAYKAQGINPEKVQLRTLRTPGEGWRADDVEEAQYINTFHKGDNISVALISSGNFYLQPAEVRIRFVYRDETGAVQLGYVTEDTYNWKELWYDKDYHKGELDLHNTPTQPGSYTLELYFDGLPFGSTSFTIEQ